ncbi:helix-turn-helix transcriptional regulator [Candidatus Palauibacter sp.]|uniref:helix-turn-helix transcriptional regulator n=1 Tax=Candidatus Palauibacter sp. TaxID=3101350 RepID=UPI003B59504D
MTPQDRFERTLALLYSAALADAKWVSAAAAVNDLTRTSGHSLGYGDPRRKGEPEVFLARCFSGRQRRKDWEDLYFDRYWGRDEAMPRLRTLPPGELAHQADFYTDEEKKTSPAYNDFRRVTRSQDGLFMLLDGLDGCGILWSVSDSAQPGGWGYDQIRDIRRLAPHIRHFVRVRRLMEDAEALGASLAELLENRQSGIIQLDRRGRILEANDQARALLLRGDGLRDKKGSLTAEVPAEDVELRRLLAAVLPLYGTQGAGGSMKITRPGAGTPLVLEIHPVGGMRTDYRAWQVGALVLIVDPASRSRIDPALAAAALGLTPAESRVAVALAAGRTVAEISRALGVAEGTVRVHLKHSYRKLGITGQTELARRILSLEAIRGSSRSP